MASGYASSSAALENPDLPLDMREEDQKLLLTFLRCRRCSDLATDAVDTVCCHVLLCEACLQQLQRVCPDCSRSCSSSPNHLARRLIGCQPWRCQHCGADGSRSNAADHRQLCPGQRRECPAPDCQFAGTPDEFLEHLTSQHSAQLLSKTALLFGSGSAGRQAAGARGYPQRRHLGSRAVPLFLSGEVLGDPSRTWASETGKAYCSRPLNGPSCNCCDGNCGPRNGCNCVDCMRRDLAAFGIRPGERALVNREGVISRLSPSASSFYCGRPNMGHDPDTDGFCGPNNGNNCHACRQLDRQARDRYADIVRLWD